MTPDGLEWNLTWNARFKPSTTPPATSPRNSSPATRKGSGARLILEHLALTYSGTVKAMERVLGAGKPLARPATLKEGIATALVVEVGHMPGGRQAPEMTRPRGLPAEQSVARIHDDFAAMRNALEQCGERFGASVKIANHPILGPLSVQQWCKFHWVHTRHHMKQVERLRRKGA